MEWLQLSPMHKQFAITLDSALANIETSIAQLGKPQADHNAVFSCTSLYGLHFFRVDYQGVLCVLNAEIEIYWACPSRTYRRSFQCTRVRISTKSKRHNQVSTLPGTQWSQPHSSRLPWSVCMLSLLKQISRAMQAQLGQPQPWYFFPILSLSDCEALKIFKVD